MRLIHLSILLCSLLLAAPAAQAEPNICEGLDAPGLLMGGGRGQPLCNWFKAPLVLVVNTASNQSLGLDMHHQLERSCPH